MINQSSEPCSFFNHVHSDFHVCRVKLCKLRYSSWNYFRIYSRPVGFFLFSFFFDMWVWMSLWNLLLLFICIRKCGRLAVVNQLLSWTNWMYTFNSDKLLSITHILSNFVTTIYKRKLLNPVRKSMFCLVMTEWVLHIVEGLYLDSASNHSTSPYFTSDLHEEQKDKRKETVVNEIIKRNFII